MQVAIVGAGVVGAAIAYRLSQQPGLGVQVFDRRAAHQWEATGAALGVLIAALSPKLKGKHLRLRQASLRLYETLIPELIAYTHVEIPFNRHGIVHLCFTEPELTRWQTVQTIREAQGFPLELWSVAQLQQALPTFAQARSLGSGLPVVGAVYSPCDRQVQPIPLTQALLQGAIQNKATLHYETPVLGFHTPTGADQQTVTHLCTATDMIPIDWLIIAAGLGSVPLATSLQSPFRLQPVLGQAMQLYCPGAMAPHSPVINGLDVHCVPLDRDTLWVGATVEMPEGETAPSPNPKALEQLHQQAIALNPSLAQARVLQTWQGLRPRPCDQAAPVIEPLLGYTNVMLASGHYRNGILLAPITAQQVEAFLLQQ